MSEQKTRQLTQYDTSIYFVPDPKPEQKKNEHINALNKQLSTARSQLSSLSNQLGSANGQLSTISNQLGGIATREKSTKSLKTRAFVLFGTDFLHTGLLAVTFLASSSASHQIVEITYLLFILIEVILSKKPSNNTKRYTCAFFWVCAAIMYFFVLSHSINPSTKVAYFYICALFHLYPIYTGLKQLNFISKREKKYAENVEGIKGQQSQQQKTIRQIEEQKKQKQSQINKLSQQLQQIKHEKVQQAQAPTDQQFDAWLEGKVRESLRNTIRKVGLDNEITNPRQQLLRIRGYVLPGMKDARHYDAQELRYKQGEDGKRRFSVNQYTYFFPAEHRLVVFTYTINAMNWNDYRETTRECFYQDVTSAITEDDQDMIHIDGKPQRYRTQRFLLRLCDGTAISATVRSQPLDMLNSLPVFDIPQQSDLDNTVAKLRMLLRGKKV